MKEFKILLQMLERNCVLSAIYIYKEFVTGYSSFNYKCFDTEGKLRISRNQNSNIIALELNVFRQPLHAEVYLYHAEVYLYLYH